MNAVTWVDVLLLWVLPVGFYAFYTRRILRLADDNKVTRRQRLLPLIVSIICLLLSMWLIPTKWTIEGNYLARLKYDWLECVLMLNTVALAITLFYRISLHMVAVGGFAGYFLVLLLLDMVTWHIFLCFGFIPLLWWARAHQGAHTVGQLLTGVLIGIVLGGVLCDAFGPMLFIFVG